MKKKLALAFVAGWACADIRAAYKQGVFHRGAIVFKATMENEGHLPMTWPEYITYLQTGYLPPHVAYKDPNG